MKQKIADFLIFFFGIVFGACVVTAIGTIILIARDSRLWDAHLTMGNDDEIWGNLDNKPLRPLRNQFN